MPFRQPTIRLTDQRRGWRYLPTCAGCLVWLALLAAASHAAGQQEFVDREHPIKAAYVYNFAKYVRWPDQCYDHPTFTVGILGESPIEPHLQQIAQSKSVSGRKIRIVRLRPQEAPPFCHIVFVTAGYDAPGLAELMSRWQQSPTLLIGESEQFPRTGGVIGLYTEDNRVRFVINTSRAREAGLSISSKLLRLGKLVE